MSIFSGPRGWLAALGLIVVGVVGGGAGVWAYGPGANGKGILEARDSAEARSQTAQTPPQATQVASPTGQLPSQSRDSEIARYRESKTQCEHRASETVLYFVTHSRSVAQAVQEWDEQTGGRTIMEQYRALQADRERQMESLRERTFSDCMDSKGWIERQQIAP